MHGIRHVGRRSVLAGAGAVALIAAGLRLSIGRSDSDSEPEPTPITATPKTDPEELLAVTSSPTPIERYIPPTATPIQPETPPPTATVSPTPTTETLSLLTGLPMDETVINRRPLAIKIGNNPEARPHWGLTEAELVMEHYTEGGVTRYTALFQASNSVRIGPLRSARLIDIQISQEYKSLFAHVGGSPGVREALKVLGPLDRDEFFYSSDGPFFRTGDRVPPENAWVNLQRLRAEVDRLGLSPEVSIEPWDFYDGDSEPVNAQLVVVPTPPMSSETYRSRYQYDSDSGKYLKFIGQAPAIDGATGEQISVSNLIIQTVGHYITDIEEDSLGNMSLEIQTIGEGKVIVFRNGSAVEGIWKKPTQDTRTQFSQSDGSPIQLKRGNSWVHFLPDNETVNWQASLDA